MSMFFFGDGADDHWIITEGGQKVWIEIGISGLFCNVVNISESRDDLG